MGAQGPFSTESKIEIIQSYDGDVSITLTNNDFVKTYYMESNRCARRPRVVVYTWARVNVLYIVVARSALAYVIGAFASVTIRRKDRARGRVLIVRERPE